MHLSSRTNSGIHSGSSSPIAGLFGSLLLGFSIAVFGAGALAEDWHAPGAQPEAPVTRVDLPTQQFATMADAAAASPFVIDLAIASDIEPSFATMADAAFALAGD